MKTAIRVSVLFGLIFAVIFVAVWRFYPNMPVDLAIQIENVQLILWPASIFLMAAVPSSTGEHVFLYGTAILLNILFYSLIGAMLWLGIKRKSWRPILGLAVVLGLIWLRVLTLS